MGAFLFVNFSVVVSESGGDRSNFDMEFVKIDVNDENSLDKANASHSEGGSRSHDSVDRGEHPDADDATSFCSETSEETSGFVDNLIPEVGEDNFFAITAAHCVEGAVVEEDKGFYDSVFLKPQPNHHWCRNVFDTIHFPDSLEKISHELLKITIVVDSQIITGFAVPGTEIFKQGSTSGFTQGEFSSVSTLTLNGISYADTIIVAPKNRKRRFASPGDSGSIYYAKVYFQELNRSFFLPIALHVDSFMVENIVRDRKEYRSAGILITNAIEGACCRMKGRNLVQTNQLPQVTFMTCELMRRFYVDQYDERDTPNGTPILNYSKDADTGLQYVVGESLSDPSA